MSSVNPPDLKLQERAKRYVGFYFDMCYTFTYRFNVSLNTDKKVARASRFGIVSEDIPKASLQKVTSPKKLKERTQKYVFMFFRDHILCRFTSPVSIISKEEDDKRKLRQSRFGTDEKTQSKLATRAQRFAV